MRNGYTEQGVADIQNVGFLPTLWMYRRFLPVEPLNADDLDILFVVLHTRKVHWRACGCSKCCSSSMQANHASCVPSSAEWLVTRPFLKSACRIEATAIASRVLPTPGGPQSATRRLAERQKRNFTCAKSRSRPTMGVGGEGERERGRRSGSEGERRPCFIFLMVFTAQFTVSARDSWVRSSAWRRCLSLRPSSVRRKWPERMV